MEMEALGSWRMAEILREMLAEAIELEGLHG